jgi:hypothetical protein
MSNRYRVGPPFGTGKVVEIVRRVAEHPDSYEIAGRVRLFLAPLAIER